MITNLKSRLTKIEIFNFIGFLLFVYGSIFLPTVDIISLNWGNQEWVKSTYLGFGGYFSMIVIYPLFIGFLMLFGCQILLLAVLRRQQEPVYCFNRLSDLRPWFFVSIGLIVFSLVVILISPNHSSAIDVAYTYVYLRSGFYVQLTGSLLSLICVFLYHYQITKYEPFSTKNPIYENN